MQGTSAATLSDDPTLLTSEVCEIMRYKAPALRDAVKARRFPPPIRLSARRNGWRRSVVMAHLAALEAASGAAAVAHAK